MNLLGLYVLETFIVISGLVPTYDMYADMCGDCTFPGPGAFPMTDLSVYTLEPAEKLALKAQS